MRNPSRTMRKASPLERALSWLSAVQVTRPGPVILLVVASLLPAGFLASKLTLKTSFSELLPDNKPSVIEKARWNTIHSTSGTIRSPAMPRARALVPVPRDIKMNFLIFFAVPLSIGVGAGYALNVMKRRDLLGHGEIRRPVIGTRGAIVLLFPHHDGGYLAFGLRRRIGRTSFCPRPKTFEGTDGARQTRGWRMPTRAKFRLRRVERGTSAPGAERCEAAEKRGKHGPPE